MPTWDMTFRALPGMPLIKPGDDLAAVITQAAAADGRLTGRDARLCQLFLNESVTGVCGRHVVTIHRLAFTGTGADVDMSNSAEGYTVLLPEAPDASARAIRARIRDRTGATVAVIVSDSFRSPQGKARSEPRSASRASATWRNRRGR